jgi:hypothetical protein
MIITITRGIIHIIITGLMDGEALMVIAVGLMDGEALMVIAVGLMDGETLMAIATDGAILTTTGVDITVITILCGIIIHGGKRCYLKILIIMDIEIPKILIMLQKNFIIKKIKKIYL